MTELYKENDIVIGKVTGIQNYGAFVSFENGQIGLIHISEISAKFVKNIEDYVKVGDQVRVKVLGIEDKNNYLKLSLKALNDRERQKIKKPLIFNKPKRVRVLNSEHDFEKLRLNLDNWINKSLEEQNMIKTDFTNIIENINFESYCYRAKQINDMINNKSGAGNDFLGWTTWPKDYDKEELERMVKCAKYVRDNYDILVVCGIGGSYLGAKAAIDALRGLYSDDKLEIIYLGQTFSPLYIAQVMNYLKEKKFAINVISKSGTTTETSIAFRLVKDLLEKQVGKDEARKSIFATTDKERGALKTLCNTEGYETFVLPDDIGGRYSVLTAVGLFPIACAGLDIKEMIRGAYDAMIKYDNDDIMNNDCYKYAIIRDYFYHHNKSVELFVTYEPSLSHISEWLKQLFGESEGKEGKGLLPGSVTFSTDLHSLGQFIQDGSHILFETIVKVENPSLDIEVPHDDADLDGLNYLEGKTLSFINEKAMQGTIKAHVEDGKVPNIVISVDKMDAYHLGGLFYFFMRACAMSAYLLDINPFNQPGVEIYKRNMFHLLGKKGY
ncbi:MAG: glucose-6-phosphate isomerase [Erysipelotrichales bacterium]|nr:glucose-6-phosphate isomerase [Erysipelotrichales bacterium]